jgi:hypothetical protein
MKEGVDMHVNGRCHCGRITYDAIVDPARVTICHCTDCQALTGSAYRVTVRVAAEDFVLRTGEPSVYVKVADSGARRAQAFCSHCGSPLYTCAADGEPQTYGLRVGCIEQRRELVPRKQIWCRSALEWTTDLGPIEKRDRE